MTSKAADSGDEAPVVLPTRGATFGVRFDGRVRWHWWGSEDDGEDLVAARGAHVLMWPTEEECLADAARAG